MDGARPIFSGATSLRWNSWAPRRAASAQANVRSSIGRTSFPRSVSCVNRPRGRPAGRRAPARASALPWSVLRDIALLGCAGEVECERDGKEVAYLMKFHGLFSVKLLRTILTSVASPIQTRALVVVHQEEGDLGDCQRPPGRHLQLGRVGGRRRARDRLDPPGRREEGDLAGSARARPR
jgi:hypothetical protein